MGRRGSDIRRVVNGTDDGDARCPAGRDLGHLGRSNAPQGQHGRPKAPGCLGKRGQARVEAENAWLGMHVAFDLPVHLFRLAGIYGPGRNQIESLRNGTAKRIIKPGQVFSRIHVEDIAGILFASMAHVDPGTVYNVCDDEPAPPQEVVAWAADLIGVDPPPEIPFDEAELSPMARSFYADSKRVSNARVKDDLGYRFRYPTYREGLKALA